jgi:hypothetical protein
MELLILDGIANGDFLSKCRLNHILSYPGVVALPGVTESMLGVDVVSLLVSDTLVVDGVSVDGVSVDVSSNELVSDC